MAQVSVPKHEVIMRQGAPPCMRVYSRAHCTPRCCCCRCAAGDKGNNFYVIKEGTAEVTLTDASGTKHVRTLSAGNSCGELSLLTGEPRSATVKATSDTLVLLMVNRRMFYARIGDAILRKRARWKHFIRDLPAIGAAPPRPRPPSRLAGRPAAAARALPATRQQHAARGPHAPPASAPRPSRAAAPCCRPVLPPRAPLPDTRPLPRPLPRPPAWPGDATGDYEHGLLADAVAVVEVLDGGAVTKPMVSPRRTSPCAASACYHPLTLLLRT